MEQARANFPFQIADLHAQRRLADPYPLRCTGKVPFLCNSQEVANMSKVHGYTLYIWKSPPVPYRDFHHVSLA